MRIRPAEQSEASAVVGLVEASLLEIEAGLVADILTNAVDGEVLVAVAADDGPILGALVLRDRTIEAVAVRPNRRGQGIGSALVEAVAERCDGPLLAECDGEVTAFYEALGFELTAIGENRYRGRRM